MHYIMGSNIAGFLPDGEPFMFDTYPEALSAMADDMRFFADEWDDSVNYREEDYRNAAQCADDGTITDAFGALLGFTVMPSTDGREWWIHACSADLSDCEHDMGAW